MGRIAILGGTGPEGLGLGMRLALLGEEVVIGSRRLERAEAAAQEARERLATVGCRTPVSGAENAAAIDGADLVVVSFPYSGVAELLPSLAPKLAGKLVLDLVNPLVLRGKTFCLEEVAAGSAAEAIQQVLPGSRVVSGFKNQSAEELKDITEPLHGDVLVCSDHKEAREQILALVRRIPKLRAVDAGPLINARFLEAITALLLNLNRRHKAVTSIQILGL